MYRHLGFSIWLVYAFLIIAGNISFILLCKADAYREQGYTPSLWEIVLASILLTFMFVEVVFVVFFVFLCAMAAGDVVKNRLTLVSKNRNHIMCDTIYLFRQWMKAKKERFCPVISFIDPSQAINKGGQHP